MATKKTGNKNEDYEKVNQICCLTECLNIPPAYF